MTKDFGIGDVVLLNRKGKESNFYSVAQRFFTKMPYTHCAVGTGYIFNTVGVLTADECTNIQPISNYFKEDNTDIEIYKLNVPIEVKKPIIEELYNKYSGKLYGYTQILWFIYRWFMEIFGKDVRNNRNWISTNGIICSELVYYYLRMISNSVPDLSKTLDEWRADNVSAGDIKIIINRHPDLFINLYSGNTKDLNKIQ